MRVMVKLVFLFQFVSYNEKGQWLSWKFEDMYIDDFLYDYSGKRKKINYFYHLLFHFLRIFFVFFYFVDSIVNFIYLLFFVSSFFNFSIDFLWVYFSLVKNFLRKKKNCNFIMVNFLCHLGLSIFILA